MVKLHYNDKRCPVIFIVFAVLKICKNYVFLLGWRLSPRMLANHLMGCWETIGARFLLPTFILKSRILVG